MVANQTRVIGPNHLPIAAVPRFWMANSPMKMTTAIGRM